MHHPTDRIAHTTAFVTSVVKYWLERDTSWSLTCYKTREVLNSPRQNASKTCKLTRTQCNQRERERNVLFNDALNTFYLRLYGVRHMVKDHSDKERGNPLPPHRLLFPINSKGSFICTIPQAGEHIPWPLLHQSWSTGWNEK